ncbi:MAG: protein-glutamate O-methyltransferase [Spirochaetales bacterium]|nr:protein-glutamate O-methyltransferase [Spirochaetales bacterium]
MKLEKKQRHKQEHEYPFFTFKALSKNEFRRLSELVESRIGIRMPESKKIMLESRLHKRLRALGFTSFPQYCDYLFSDEGFNKELHHFFDVITTNKTDFFREPVHFEQLVNYILPELINRDQKIKKKLNFWSAGCATGEEPYSLAMVLHDFSKRQIDFRFSIYATDISTQVLEKAELGIYNQDKIEPVPTRFKNKYLLRSKDRSKRLVRVAPQIRSLVQFKRLNLMDRNFSLPHEMDVIFCRNVIIYFERPTQELLIGKFYKCLRMGGYLFLGHSETLCGMPIPLVTALPTIYKKIG